MTAGRLYGYVGTPPGMPGASYELRYAALAEAGAEGRKILNRMINPHSKEFIFFRNDPGEQAPALTRFELVALC